MTIETLLGLFTKHNAREFVYVGKCIYCEDDVKVAIKLLDDSIRVSGGAIHCLYTIENKKFSFIYKCDECFKFNPCFPQYVIHTGQMILYDA